MLIDLTGMNRFQRIAFHYRLLRGNGVGIRSAIRLAINYERPCR